MRANASTERILAAISAANETILRATSLEDLYQGICDVAVNHGRFKAAEALLGGPDDTLHRVAGAWAPDFVLSSNSGRISEDDLASVAFQSGKLCISKQSPSDGADCLRLDVVAAPIICSGSPLGAFVFYFEESGLQGAKVGGLIEPIVRNVSFALEKFEVEKTRRNSEQHRDSISRMFTALCATNEAIMRAKTREDLCHQVCSAAALGGNFTSAVIAIAKAESEFLEIVASAGSAANQAKNLGLAIGSSRPERQSAGSTAFDTGRPYISNDYLADQKLSFWHEYMRSTGTRSGAAWPLLEDGRPVGVLMFMSSELGTFTPELVELLQRLADNLSFAFENFNRADQKAAADKRIEYLATHDALTTLPNREMFNQLLRSTIEMAGNNAKQFAVLFIDLDRFKIINDSLGHVAGDDLLIEIAKRLRQAMRTGDKVARLGGDEFVMILEAGERREIEAFARKLLVSIGRPLNLSGHECHTTASIGISLFPVDGTDDQTLTKCADMAMYLAKDGGKNDFRFYTPDLKTQPIERLTLESSLRHALDRGQLELHYQPKVDVVTGIVTGVEALVRWQHPDLGLLAPRQFISLAEELGLIVEIERWVLREACSQNMRWQSQGLRAVSMAVNISPLHFADDNLVEDINIALAATGMPPELLQLEVTESMVLQNVPRAIKLLDAIQSKGIRLAIDDFGVGYSSMAQMKQFPIDAIKIDRSFVRDLLKGREDRIVAEAIISVGKALGAKVVAEGVETAEQEVFLRDHACDEMQGFLFCKAVPADAIAEMLHSVVCSSPSIQPEQRSSVQNEQVRSHAEENNG